MSTWTDAAEYATRQACLSLGNFTEGAYTYAMHLARFGHTHTLREFAAAVANVPARYIRIREVCDYLLGDD